MKGLLTKSEAMMFVLKSIVLAWVFGLSLGRGLAHDGGVALWLFAIGVFAGMGFAYDYYKKERKGGDGEC